MQDRYLFRAKRIDNGEWVEGNLITDEKDSCHAYIGYLFGVIDGTVHDIDVVEVEPYTICQCTGINDKNGKLIWENDIIKCGEYITRVLWNEVYASWVLTRIGWLYHHFFGESQNPEDCEVIGNILDNPELLEQEG